MKPLKTFVFGIMAGICIAIGGTVFLSVESKVIGALFFTVGLFVICTSGFNLFTGKVCYIFENDKAYAFSLILIWCGNLMGTIIVALVELLTRIGPALTEKASTICSGKLNDTVLSIFILSAFCNILIYFAVDGFKNNPHELGKYLSLFFGVAVFILCGFEHCVANMYYFTIAKMWTSKTILYIIVMTFGNSCGGVLFPILKKLNS